MKIRLALWGLGVLCCVSSTLSAQLPTMYWSDRGVNTIRRAFVDGSQPELLASGMSQVRGVAVDFENDMLYWNDNGSDRIQRAPLSGGPPEDLVTGLGFPAGIDIDAAGGKMYWADATTNKIQRANLDGTNVEDLVTKLGDPYYVRLDLENRHLYWSDYGTDKIQRSNLDGTHVVDIISTGLIRTRGLDLDLAGGKIYWADRGTDQVQRANLDGTDIETLYTAQPPRGVDAAPHGVAVDAKRGHVYWVDNGLVTIQRADLDGNNVVNVLTAASGILTKPWEIVLDLRLDQQVICDFDRNGICDAADIDALTQVVVAGTDELMFDLNQDQLVNQQDREVWVGDLRRTYFGDANLDGVFDSSDMVRVFQAGEYQDDVASNSGWSEGDWDGDLDFTSQDFVVALQDGGYGMGERAFPVQVPEPCSSSLILLGLAGFALSDGFRRRFTALKSNDSDVVVTRRQDRKF